MEKISNTSNSGLHWTPSSVLVDIWHFFHLPRQTKLRSLNFGNNGWHVHRYLYDKCKKTMILVFFETTLLETKYIAHEIVNISARQKQRLEVRIEDRLNCTPLVCPKLPRAGRAAGGEARGVVGQGVRRNLGSGRIGQNGTCWDEWTAFVVGEAHCDLENSFQALQNLT